ncbi:hypothetical protein F7725_026858%2C partial [Xyrichtys novacula]|uniref:Uncharacterized protein n=1 Tax=Xyrichtys novacula TaxID=13765 RepID=A0AAV1EXU0_XYRNO|nr:hypothetical protein F7725_026858%2C partial [Xyrichtys novacula]
MSELVNCRVICGCISGLFSGLFVVSQEIITFVIQRELSFDELVSVSDAGTTPAANYTLWYIDSYDKLKPYAIAINGCIEGFRLCTAISSHFPSSKTVIPYKSTWFFLQKRCISCTCPDTYDNVMLKRQRI